jgi:AcrR family transcriptional regulator
MEAMESLRRDAARNRARIIEAAQAAAARGEPLALNAVARAADVGVGTIYRHFTTLEELEEVVVWDRFDELERILQQEGPDQLEEALAAHVDLLTRDALFEKVTSRLEPALAETAQKRDALIDRLGNILQQAQEAGGVRQDIDANGVLLLACGLAHALRSGQLQPDHPRAVVLRRVWLAGLRSA